MKGGQTKMRTLTIKFVLTDDNRIATVENVIGLPSDTIESHLLIIGLLENLKQKHLNKLNTQFEQTVKKNKDDLDL